MTGMTVGEALRYTVYCLRVLWEEMTHKPGHEYQWDEGRDGD